MSCSKPLPPFTYDVLCYLNRDQLERFSIVCRPLKNFIDRYFSSKPYRIFDRLEIRGGSYALFHNGVQWHPNRQDYSVQQFLAGQKCSIDESKGNWDDPAYYSFVEMRPYLGPTVRIKRAIIYVGEDSIYNPEQIEQMESIAYLWREGTIYIVNHRNYGTRMMLAEDFQPILNSPIILRCQTLDMDNAYFRSRITMFCTLSKLLKPVFTAETRLISGYNIGSNFLRNRESNQLLSFTTYVAKISTIYSINFPR
ncbi:hypothetical protein Ddc_24795 [Ditylenchus destructor]|nr:hypothetical protein Ddc_24795 [Ditylenchus destructor]